MNRTTRFPRRRGLIAVAAFVASLWIASGASHAEEGYRLPPQPWVDIIDAAIDHLEAHVRPMPDDENKTDDWYAWANDRANAIASTFTEEG